MNLTPNENVQDIDVAQVDHAQDVSVEQVGNGQDIPVTAVVEILRGFSPTIEVEEVEGGFNVTITDKEHTEQIFIPAASAPESAVLARINDGISVIDSGLTYARGVVEVRMVGDMLWVIDSGVYNFTDSFKTAKNRTVLQFDLPKEISDKIHNVNGAYGATGTISYFPALAYENVTYTTFNCQSYLKRSKIGEEFDTFQMVYTGLSAVSGGGLCGFHLKLPVFLVPQEKGE